MVAQGRLCPREADSIQCTLLGVALGRWVGEEFLSEVELEKCAVFPRVTGGY